MYKSYKICFRTFSNQISQLNVVPEKTNRFLCSSAHINFLTVTRCTYSYLHQSNWDMFFPRQKWKLCLIQWIITIIIALILRSKEIPFIYWPSTFSQRKWRRPQAIDLSAKLVSFSKFFEIILMDYVVLKNTLSNNEMFQFLNIACMKWSQRKMLWKKKSDSCY